MVRGGKVALIRIPPPLRPTPRDLPTFFTWESPSPFQMLPPMGLLEPGQACRVKVTFQPPMAVIYEAQATCWYGEGSKQKSSIQLQAVGEAQPLTCPQSPLLHLPGKQSLQCAPPTPALARLHAQVTSLQRELCSSRIVVNRPKVCSQHARLAEQAVSMGQGRLCFTVDCGVGAPCSDLYLILSPILQPLYRIALFTFSFFKTLCVRP